MAINLDKHKEALIAGWKDVLDEKTDTNWVLFGYDGQSNDLKFVGKGDGGLDELIDEFNSGKIQYAFLKVDQPNGSLSKYVLINWQGEGAPTVRKGTCANHIKHVANFFTGFHLTMHARTEDDLDEKVIQDKLAKAGSAFNFKTSRPEELPPSGPVGTVYQKVNPGETNNNTPEKPVRSSVIAQRINTFTQAQSPQSSPIKSPTKLEPKPIPETEEQPKTSPLKNIDKIKMSLESPSQIQYEPIIDPADLSPSTENDPGSFSAINYAETKQENSYRDIEPLKQSEPMIKQNILENDMFDASYSSSNENDDDDSDNKFSTIKRSPYSKNNIADDNDRTELTRQNTVIENVNFKKDTNGTTLDADESEITFDPGDIITHIEQIDAGWWQGLGPHGVFGLFPANYVELLPCQPR
ncbi:hypothetical protein HF086_017404 [Spodoptera exigua]|uniref:Drebrin-like protein n=1 Tax=Spodoptera exigua TaxID=7107 RepID=A0A922MYZ3_SPOEX|nr:hypothetical protein HF086_017404 [Spodoptera exigua]